MQFLTPSQRLFARFYGQYTGDVLVPMEQIALGGPDSVRSLPVSDALGDRGYQATLEYQVDAPGFADMPSPFDGRRWGDLLRLQLFTDHGRAWSAAGGASHRYTGAGAGLRLHLPHLHDPELQFAAAVPVGGAAIPPMGTICAPGCGLAWRSEDHHMNHVYRIVFNRARGLLQVASEFTSARGAGAGRLAGATRRATLAVALALAAGPAVAQVAPNQLPTGGTVVGGDATIGSTGNTMTVTQNSARALIQWDSFDIGVDASVVFSQDSGHVALN